MGNLVSATGLHKPRCVRSPLASLPGPPRRLACATPVSNLTGSAPRGNLFPRPRCARARHAPFPEAGPLRCSASRPWGLAAPATRTACAPRPAHPRRFASYARPCFFPGGVGGAPAALEQLRYAPLSTASTHVDSSNPRSATTTSHSSHGLATVPRVESQFALAQCLRFAWTIREQAQRQRSIGVARRCPWLTEPPGRVQTLQPSQFAALIEIRLSAGYGPVPLLGFPTLAPVSIRQGSIRAVSKSQLGTLETIAIRDSTTQISTLTNGPTGSADS